MRIGDLVRFHGAMLSTGPVALVVDWRPGAMPSDLGSSYEKLKVIWQNGIQYGKAHWLPAYTLEKVIEK